MRYYVAQRTTVYDIYNSSYSKQEPVNINPVLDVHFLPNILNYNQFVLSHCLAKMLPPNSLPPNMAVTNLH